MGWMCIFRVHRSCPPPPTLATTHHTPALPPLLAAPQGNLSSEPVQQAASIIEMMDFASRGPPFVYFLQAKASDNWQPSRRCVCNADGEPDFFFTNNYQWQLTDSLPCRATNRPRPRPRPRPCSMSQYKAEHMKRKRAAEAALPAWVAGQPSLEAIRQHPRLPASLLPRLEGLWAQRGGGQQPQQGQQQQQPEAR